MNLIFNSFVLSFQTLWRYLLVMPFVVIPGLLVVITLFIVPFIASGGVFLSLLLVAPILFGGLILLVATFLITAFMTFNIMMGCRSAFAAMGRRNDLDFGRMVGKSMTFTIVQIVVSIFLFLVLGGVLAAIALTSPTGFSPEMFMASPELAIVQSAQNPVYLIIGLLWALLSLALSALLAVPMAGAAISATPKMGPTDAFIGLGTAFFPVLMVLIVTQVLCTVTGAYAFLITFFGQGAMMLYQLNAGLPVEVMPMQDLAITAGMTLVVFWSSSWFYAAAALGWQSYRDERDEAIAYKAEVDRFSPDELRRLRELREQNRSPVGH